MLTLEPPQRPGLGMQHSRSSIALWHSCWEVAESRLEFAASKAACLGLREMLTSFTVYIHSHIIICCPKLAVNAHILASAETRPRHAHWHIGWEVVESRLEFAASKAACCGLHQKLTSSTVYISIYMLSEVCCKFSHLSHRRDQAEACTAVGKSQKAD